MESRRGKGSFQESQKFNRVIEQIQISVLKRWEHSGMTISIITFEGGEKIE